MSYVETQDCQSRVVLEVYLLLELGAGASASHDGLSIADNGVKKLSIFQRECGVVHNWIVGNDKRLSR